MASCGPSRFALLVLVSTLGACADQPAISDHHADPEYVVEMAQKAAPVTCSPKLKAYLVKGKHNGGWDKNALTYSCPPHPSHAKDNSDWISGDHYGNDIFGAKGTPLVACVDGTIIKVGNTSIGGKTVTIRDACGWNYYYAHLDTHAAGIYTGKKVTAGTVIGTLGNTGNASGTSPHLHYSIYPGTYTAGIDPFPLLQQVDANSCSGGTPNPSLPKMDIWSTTAAKDVRKEGPSNGIADAFEGDEFHVDIFVENKPTGAATSDWVRVGYWVESPYLEVVTWVIHSDWPAKDKKTWKLNDSNSAPGNPSKTNPPSTAKMNFYAMGPGETKRLRLTVRAKNYSLGKVDHPDVRAWIWHVGNYYGEMTGFYDAVETNKAGKLLRTYVQHDVFGADHWEFNGAAAETEGWHIHKGVSDLKVNTSVKALAIKQTGSDPSIKSPKVSLTTAKWKGLEMRVRHHKGLKKGQLFWITNKDTTWNEAKSLVYEIAGDSDWHKVVLNGSKFSTWKDTITQLRLDPTDSESGWYDVDWIRAVQSPGKTTGDADADKVVASLDCNDNDPSLKLPKTEVCGDTIDNDCDGQVDEGCVTCKPAPEVCDGKDNNCDDKVPANEQDGDGDGHWPCKGDCDDTNSKVHPGAQELCDGIDNDCDGATDEDLTVGTPCSAGQGACKSGGILKCGPNGMECSAIAGEPSAEECNGVDDDCDGEVDEDFDLGGPCTIEGSICTVEGVWACSEDGSEVICKGDSAVVGGELCNGLDDDCDGEIDEDFPLGQPCTGGRPGVCSTAPGTWSCGQGGGTTCQPIDDPSGPEICDGLDNDCDGEVDDGFPVGESCEVVIGDCTAAGSWACSADGAEVVCDTPAGACGQEVTGAPGSDAGGSVGADVTWGGTGGDASQSPGFVSGAAQNEGGCSASPGAGSPATAWLLLAGLALLAWRRRRAGVREG